MCVRFELQRLILLLLHKLTTHTHSLSYTHTHQCCSAYLEHQLKNSASVCMSVICSSLFLEKKERDCKRDLDCGGNKSLQLYGAVNFISPLHLHQQQEQQHRHRLQRARLQQHPLQVLLLLPAAHARQFCGETKEIWNKSKKSRKRDLKATTPV